MSADLIKFAFVAGEIAPSYHGRSDLEKYDLALATALNWFVDYRGGISTRPGLQFIDYIKEDDKNTKFIPFHFSSDLANTNLILFGENYIRFIQDGGYVLESARAISAITQVNPGVLTSNSHGFNDGDWVRLQTIGGMVELESLGTGIVANAAANTFTLTDPYGNVVDTTAFAAYTGGGTASRIYELASDYSHLDLPTLRAHQIRDTIRLTHPNYPVMNLIRNDSADWVLEEEDFDTTATRPGTIDVEVTDAGSTYGKAYAVSSVDANGQESIPSEFVYTSGADQVSGYHLDWTPVADAEYYKVYASVLVKHPEVLTRGTQLGFLGRAQGAVFIDDGATLPDFTHTPTRVRNPFGNGVITKVTVTAGGSLHARSVAYTLTDALGTGAVLSPNVSVDVGGTTGPIVGVDVLHGGEGYTGPSLSMNTGAGATFSIDKTPPSGNYPSVGAICQQRQVYAGTDNDPLTVWGSRPGQFSNFGYSDITLATDSYEHEIDSEDVSQIKHLVSVKGGMLVFNRNGVWQLTGGEGGAITPLNVSADIQTRDGASDLPPLKIANYLLYSQAQGNSIRALAYNDQAKVYESQDVSILANHLLTDDLKIVSWDFALTPYSTAWGVRSDGRLLSFAFIRDQDVYAWARHQTKGLFKDVIAIREDDAIAVYFVVQRYINGRWSKFIERFHQRLFDHVEDAFCVDAGLKLNGTSPDANLTFASAAVGTGVLVTASSNVFAVGDVDKIIRGGGARAVITAYNSPTSVTVQITRAVTEIIPETDDPTVDGDLGEPLELLSGDWTMDSEVTVVRGLNHLEGETVKIVADGNVLDDQVVVDGAITLDEPASRIIVGLGYRCIARNLPLTAAREVVENKRKRVTKLAVRMKDALGLEAGARLSKTYAMKTHQPVQFDEPMNFITGMQHFIVEPEWDENGQSYFVQSQPLPATILGYVAETEIGDDPD